VNRILFDTNVVSYWHRGEKRFKPPLLKLFHELGKQKTTFYVSAITIQEIGCWAIPAGAWQAVQQFMSASHLNTLPFCAGCAVEAAKLQAKGGPVSAKKSEREESKAEWHHDAAIVRTAAYHGLDMVVTTDAGLVARYASLFEEIRHVEPVR
jgi:predicted nucleic acid-binding protein